MIPKSHWNPPQHCPAFNHTHAAETLQLFTPSCRLAEASLPLNLLPVLLELQNEPLAAAQCCETLTLLILLASTHPMS